MGERDSLLVAGRGAFAKEFLDRAPEIYAAQHGGVLTVSGWTERGETDPNRAVVLHVGSGRQLGECVDYCQVHGAPMVQASTGVVATLPEPLSFAYVEAPNLSLPLLRLFKLLGADPGLFRDHDIRVIESHQKSKTSVPGTAVKLVELLGGESSAIESVRDPVRQADEFEVPPEHLGGHAIHRVTISGFGAEVTLGTRILGRETYVHGLVALWPRLCELNHGSHFVSELV